MNSVPVVYENDEILIINKPCGLAVQGGEGVVSSVDRVLPEQLGYPVHLVHRLDKETSGLLVVAKSAPSAAKWISLLQGGSVKKEYTAICFGSLKGKSGKLSDAIVHRGREQSALTWYKVLASGVFESQPVSLVSLSLGTGRMHQIRIHMAQAGCPLIADDKYGNFKLNKAIQKQLKIKRLQLAACRLSVPVNGKSEVFEIELPLHMQSACEQLFPSYT